MSEKDKKNIQDQAKKDLGLEPLNNTAFENNRFANGKNQGNNRKFNNNNKDNNKRFNNKNNKGRREGGGRF